MFGVGVNFDAGLVGQIVLDEGNFDWTVGGRLDQPWAPQGSAYFELYAPQLLITETLGFHDRRWGPVGQALTVKVQSVVDQARSRMGTDPEGAIQVLSLEMERIKQVPELSPETRDQLASMVQRALTEGRRRQVEVDARRQRAQENLAQARERGLVNDNLVRDQQKLNELLDRFDSVMAVGRYRLAEESAARDAATLAPRSTAPVATTLTSRVSNAVHDEMAIHIARQKGVVDMLYQIEASHVPVPDDTPILYPDAEVWRELIARRKDRYKAQELLRHGPAEKRIHDALNSPTQLEFIETPLGDVIDYLKDYHGIEIQLDTGALAAARISPSAPITKNLKGMSLRSALRLMLGELGLTYFAGNDAIWITTAYNPTVFCNLLAYAPGMHTSLADVCAVLEAELPRDDAAPTAKTGKIDDQARRLIERARGAGWQTATISDRQGKPIVTVAFDGTGRYRYQRTTAYGLREQVLCDGTSLWHLYPELGVGARRTLSRFHRAAFTQLVPWALPPVEDFGSRGGRGGRR